MYAEGVVDGVDDDGGEGAKGGEGTTARQRKRGIRTCRVGGGAGGFRRQTAWTAHAKKGLT